MKSNLLIVINEKIVENNSRFFSNRSLILYLLYKLFLKSLIEEICFWVGSYSEMFKILFCFCILIYFEKIDFLVFNVFFVIKYYVNEDCMLFRSKILLINKGDRGYDLVKKFLILILSCKDSVF